MTNIIEHKWSDGEIKDVYADSETITLHDFDVVLTINKADAIAIAKHFNLRYSDIFESLETVSLQETRCIIGGSQ